MQSKDRIRVQHILDEANEAYLLDKSEQVNAWAHL